MKKLNVSMLLLGILIFAGCNSDNDNINAEENVILIFGWYADSSCSGDCASIYKLENEQVYRDVDFNFPEDTFFEGNFELIANADYQDYEALITELPDEIFEEPNGCLDSIDCNDTFGGFYVEYENENGFHKSWRFNTQPDYIENYRSLFLDKLAELNSL